MIKAEMQNNSDMYSTFSEVFKSVLDKYALLQGNIKGNQGAFNSKQLSKLNLLLINLNKLRNKYLKSISEKVLLIINKQKI